MAKIQPGPWQVRYKQMTQSGVLSRPEIIDANGKKVNFNQKANASMAALAPELLFALEALIDKSELWARMVKSEHPGIDIEIVEQTREILGKALRQFKRL